MTVRFHESMATLAKIAIQNEVPLDKHTVIVRDGAGRLILAREKVVNAGVVEAALRKGLGGYAGQIVLVTGSAARRLFDDPTVTEVELLVEGIPPAVVLYADRRIVGMDWLRSPSSPAEGAKRLVFGSLKGGVGRSTALAVLAADLARAGKRVLVVDLDLEAPGVGFMLLPGADDPAVDRRPRFGVVDYLLENGIGGIADDELFDFVGVSPFVDGSIDVIPAVGRETDERPGTMIAKLSRALVEDRNADRVVSVAEQVREMVDRFARRSYYDAVLVDARAGMAEITAAPLLGLGAEVLLFGTNQSQTFRGYAFILAHLVSMSDFRNLAPQDDWRQRISFVQSKAPSSPAKRASFIDGLYELCADHLYDKEPDAGTAAEGGQTFSPSPEEKGRGVPHDALFVQFHPEYEAFDPVGDATQLDVDVYRGPFGAFLERAWGLLDIKREAVS